VSYEFFIAKRIIASKEYKSSVSAPIIKIAITAIAMGIIMMLVSVATGVGLQDKIREKVTAFHGDIIMSNYDTNFSYDDQVPISLDQEFYPNNGFFPNITHIQPTASKGGVIRTETDFEGIIVKGVDENYSWNYLEDYLIEGRLPIVGEESLNSEVLLSEYLANRLQIKVGDRIATFFLREDTSKPPRSVGFTIVGLYNSGFQEFDEQFLFADIRHIQRLNGWASNEVGTFELFVDDFKNIDAIGNAVYLNSPSNVDVETIRGRFMNIFDWLDMFDFNIFLIIGIMIVVAGINMITALLVLILERTHMIGLLKALGSNNWSVRKIFIYNAMYLIGVGLFWGNLIGIGFLFIQKYFKILPLDPSTYYVSEVPVYLHLNYILALNIGTFILCLAMLLIPTYIIAKISPVRALRFE